MDTDFKYSPVNYTPDCDLTSEESLQAELHEWGIDQHATVSKLEDWYKKVHPLEPIKLPIEYKVDFSLQKLFDKLAEEWRSETWHLSSIQRTISHRAYLRIIGLGKDALPLIFNSMRKEKALWFWALEAITGEDPLPSGESMDKIHEAWLKWATERGY